MAMKIRKYMAPTVPGALKKVKADLGADAIILNTRTASDGGPIKRVEVTAALDDEPSFARIEGPGTTRQNEPIRFEPDPSWPGEISAESAPGEASIGLAALRSAKEMEPDIPAREDESGNHRFEWAALSNEMAQLRNRIEALGAQPRFGLMHGLPGALSGLMARLKDRDMEEEIAYRLIRRLWRNVEEEEIGRQGSGVRGQRPEARGQKPEVRRGGFQSAIRNPQSAIGSPLTSYPPESLKREAVAWFHEHIFVAGEIAPKRGGAQVVAFVGPSGAGKTTTMGKIAAEYAVVRRKRVALMTMDTERIAATRQLELYGEIMDLPLTVLYQPEEAKGALLRHREADLILVDTPGVNPKNRAAMEHLKAFVRAIGPHETHLVLEASRDYREALRAVTQFAPLTDRLVLSKMDEVSSFGRALCIAVRTDLPLSYTTSGPAPPEHFEVAEVENWVEKILEP